MISLILFILASICSSVMDNTAHHWYKSVFNKLNPNFWNPLVSCNTAKYIPFTRYKVDSWHIFKSLCIVFTVIGIVTYKTIINQYVDVLIFGLAWNVTFDLFYTIILNRKIQ